MFEKRNHLLICAIIAMTLSLVDVSNGWKLRELTQKNDENKVLPKKPIFRDMPMKKVVKIEAINNDESVNNKELDDDATTNDEDDFTFEKVHTTHFDVPIKPVITLTNPDVEQEEEERIEVSDDTEKVASWLSHLPNFHLFSETVVNESSKQDEEDNEPSTYFGWITRAKNKLIDISTDEDTAGAEEIDWFSYLKSFNILTELLISDDANGDNDDSKNHKKSDELVPEKREPLTTQSFENLLLTIPSFIPNYTKISDIDCKRMGQIFQRQVRGQKLWALQSIVH